MVQKDLNKGNIYDKISKKVIIFERNNNAYS